jgi:Uma2 family endonuclease
MGVTTTNKLMTWQEFAALPDDGQRHELIRGELITMPPPHTNHGFYSLNIAAPLRAAVRASQSGRAYGPEGGYLLDSDPDTVRSPDASFVALARSPHLLKDGEYLRGSPEFLAEVLSPTDRLYDVEEKVEEWFAGGARLIWVVNPRRKVVIVHRPNAEPVTFRIDDTLDATDVVPGFTLPVAAIFE